MKNNSLKTLKKNKIKIGSNRNFGIVFSIVFLIISIFPLLNNGDVRIWSAIVSIVFLFLGLFNSPILTPLNILWFKFGILLGNLISPIVMGIVFFVVVTPTALLMRIFGKNLLGLKRNNKTSYWIERSEIKSKMKNQF
jgi:hypothetical protein